MERLRRLEARVLELEQRLPANHPQARLCWTGILWHPYMPTVGRIPLKPWKLMGRCSGYPQTACWLRAGLDSWSESKAGTWLHIRVQHAGQPESTLRL